MIYFSVLEHFLHTVCTIEGFSYMGLVGTFDENVLHGVFGLACITHWLLFSFE